MECRYFCVYECEIKHFNVKSGDVNKKTYLLIAFLDALTPEIEIQI
jgi:hypothetical protein